MSSILCTASGERVKYSGNVCEKKCGCIVDKKTHYYCFKHFEELKVLKKHITDFNRKIAESEVKPKIAKWSCSHVDEKFGGDYCGKCGRKVKCYYE